MSAMTEVCDVTDGVNHLLISDTKKPRDLDRHLARSSEYLDAKMDDGYEIISKACKKISAT